ncbi:flagellar filament capping protein FliD [Mesobacillus campisalis]|uniref:flagellar filament capping protein FliD n=1 Tax=Mesobacillus campisalis TaxID=1408103 RepID=UPI003B986706
MIGLRIGGLASGMDIDSLVSNLMKAERMPLDKLTQQKQWMEWQKDGYRDINLMLTELRTSASNLRLQSSFNAYSITSSNPDIATATATVNTTPGHYSVTVKQLADSAKLNSSSSLGKKSTDLVPAGSFTLATDKGSATITTDGSETYESLAKKMAGAVNANGESLGIRANFDDTTSRFFLSTKDMGPNTRIEISGGLADQLMGGTAGAYSGQGKDAQLDFKGSDGASIPITGLSSNAVTINGMNINLLKADPGTTVTFNVQSDTEAVFNSIKGFVDKYNEIIGKIETKLTEPRHRDFAPLTDEQKEAMSEKEIELWEEKAKSGLLRNEPILQNTLNSLRRAIMDPVQGIANGEIRLLSEIGINTGDYREGGKLFIDENKLKKALMERPDEVMNVFAKNDPAGPGIGDRIYKELQTSIKSLGDRAGTPGMLVDNSILSKRLREMNEEVGNWQERLFRIEDRYWNQFSAMEKAINQMNQQSLWMQQNMFGGMS